MEQRILGVFLFFVAAAAYAAPAPLVVIGAPNGSAPQMRARFAPLVRYLSQAMGRPVRFRTNNNLVTFGVEVQTHRAAIMFAAPHILSWAQKYYHYKPVLAGAGRLSFVVVARPNSHVTLKSLGYEMPVCGVPAPNLATTALLRFYPSQSLRQPHIVAVPSPAAAIAGVLHGRCRAAVVPLHAAARQHLVRTVASVGVFPNQGFAISGALSPALQQRLAQALLGAARAGALKTIQQADGISGWKTPRPLEYAHYSSLVSGMLGFAVPPASGGG
ncbi:PhnD/SsuA/transferrin family substrate-binding protein [Acidiferrobacter sp.]|uniref:phosphate/phosphite/phosphonate ABC transporter substrate-binding protein n=1 Tax=Acidiferrobacter sp. TaxID=1872107 RepID=UPI00260FB794|nr:PhnD/SsuA/transferrin family substrate-binding protein [Acidiferrobacter sp.]